MRTQIITIVQRLLLRLGVTGRESGQPAPQDAPTLGADPPTGPSAVADRYRHPVFVADFSSTTQWVAGHSWAYPNGGPTNPGDNKLDHLVPDPSYCRSGVFRASRRPEGTWSAGLLTTEGSEEGFMVRSGDVLEARVRLPRELGAWPAIWTWRDGDQEIDIFEYHPDNPDLLELSNHVKGGHRYYRHPAIRPGGWVDLRVESGSWSVTWWVNGIRAYTDRTGVGRSWHAYLIVNMSVCAGRYHPAPEPTVTEMSYEVSRLVVYRHGHR
ncbi:beta-glucanase [Streptomyces sp. NPDC006879]|uniref:beta-glucanase n=1 Tax=Streptomyces sp. NPDC006879 TaxID=3364767 RepID=UPI0036B68542